MTRVYHIVQFDSGDAYLTFDGCTWNCYYCVWRMSRWNICLPQEVKQKLEALWNSKSIEFLSVDDIVRILVKNNVKKAFFGGGEPTLDPEIKAIIRALKMKDIDVWIITNGEHLDDELVSMAKGITFSIKALDKKLHFRVTGVSNERVLDNFRKYAKSGKIVAETVYDGKYIKCPEIARIARFISSLNKEMSFRIDPVVQGVNLEDLDRCIEEVRKILPTTYRWKINSPRKFPKLLYPQIGD